MAMRNLKRSIATVSLALVVSGNAFADATAPLPAGKPAGTHQAALLALGPIFWIGLAAIALGIGVAASNNGKTVMTSTSTGTSS